MMKIRLIFIMMMIFGLADAQPENFKPMSVSEQKSAVALIAKVSESVTAMQCKFTQEKQSAVLTSVEKASGMMYYKSPKALRWEFSQPKFYVFVLNGDKVMMKASRTAKAVDASGNKMAKMMAGMILGMVNGSQLNTPEMFSAAYFSDGTNIKVKLTPVKKEIKKIYSSVEIYYSAKSGLANKIVMKESSGDVSTLKFSEVKKGVTLADTLFKL